MSSILKPALSLFMLLTLLTGLVYPAAMTGVAQLLFPMQANGSLIADTDGKIRGSELIGQPFSDPKYFWGRPSATAPYPYNAGASGGSNLGPTNPALIDAVKTRLAALRAVDPANPALIPVDLVTASASGLDPHISPAAATFQIARVARVRGLEPAKLGDLVERCTQSRLWGVLGEPRVNVLRLNQALDGLDRE